MLLSRALVVAEHRALGGSRRWPIRGLPAWCWAALPVGVFAVQETLGVLLQDGIVGFSLPVGPVLELGGALELAAGLLCVLVVRKLSVAAHRAGLALAARTPGTSRGAAPAWAVPLEVLPLPLRAPAFGGGKRAPPALG